MFSISKMENFLTNFLSAVLPEISTWDRNGIMIRIHETYIGEKVARKPEKLEFKDS